MTEVTSATQASPSLVNSRTGLADNFEMFLTLLTEQMKNQDPLNPLDSTQFVNQLVDFSSVEQQIAQNQNLESLLDVIATNADGESITAEIRASGRVTGVDMSGSEVIVQMGNISVPLSSILAVREAGAGGVEDNPYLEPTE